jgi:heme exporter protein D
METTAHIDFIAAAYAAAAIAIAVLVLWVTIDYRTQRRKIAELEKQGFTRRSTERPPRQPRQPGPVEQAKERA